MSATFSYDAAGNVTYDGQNDYAYDGEGRVCAVYNILLTRLTDYVYDAEGRRVAKGAVSGLSTPSSPMSAATYCNLETTGNFSLSAQYLLNAAGDPVTEVDGAGSNLTWAHTNIWTGGSLDATYDPKGLHFHLKDPLGTLRVQVAAGGGVGGGTEQTCFSLPFGDALNCVDTALGTADDASGLHFTGKERDTGSRVAKSGHGAPVYLWMVRCGHPPCLLQSWERSKDKASHRGVHSTALSSPLQQVS